MRAIKILFAMVLASSSAYAQLNGPLQKCNGTQTTPGAPFWNFKGAGGATVTCAYNAATASDEITLTQGAGALVTLQQAYTNGGAAGGVISLTSTGGGLQLHDNAVPLAVPLLVVEDSGSGSFFSAGSANVMVGGNGSTAELVGPNNTAYIIVGNGQVTPLSDAGTQLGSTGSRFSSVFSNAVDGGTTGALTITGRAASTWSTSSGALVIDSAAALSLGPTNATSLNVGRTGILSATLGGVADTAFTAVADTAYTFDNAGTNTDFLVEYTTKSASRTVTLPAPAAGNAGRIAFIKNNTADVTGLVISSSANSIDGATTQTTSSARGYFLVISDGTRWNIISRTTPSESYFSVYNSANLGNAVAIGQAKVTNQTVIESVNATVDVVGVGGGNFVTKLCSDGTTCAGGNTFVTCTAACTNAAGTNTACSIGNANVGAATTLTWSVTTACASTDPGENIVLHFVEGP